MQRGKNQNKLEAATWSAKNNHGVNRLNAIADIFEEFGIGVYCWKNRGNGYVGTHSSNRSMHLRTFGPNNTGSGRAFDSYISPIPYVKGFAPLKHVSGNAQDRLDCALYIRDHLTPYLTEGIFNSGKRGYNLSVKDGESVSASFWGDYVWEEHRNHIHIAI
jgi:hypothetical protein